MNLIPSYNIKNLQDFQRMLSSFFKEVIQVLQILLETKNSIHLISKPFNYLRFDKIQEKFCLENLLSFFIKNLLTQLVGLMIPGWDNESIDCAPTSFCSTSLTGCPVMGTFSARRWFQSKTNKAAHSMIKKMYPMI